MCNGNATFSKGSSTKMNCSFWLVCIIKILSTESNWSHVHGLTHIVQAIIVFSNNQYKFTHHDIIKVGTNLVLDSECIQTL